MQRKKEEEKLGKFDASNTSTKNESGSGLSSTFTALATNLATTALQRNLHAQQGYPSQGPGGDVLGSILGALGITYLKFYLLVQYNKMFWKNYVNDFFFLLTFLI